MTLEEEERYEIMLYSDDPDIQQEAAHVLAKFWCVDGDISQYQEPEEDDD